MTKRRRPKEDQAREHRITYEIVVDAHDEQECAMGWYNYLEEKLDFGHPLRCCCVKQRAISPLRVGDEVELWGLAPEDECEHEMFVMMQWDRREGLGVPLSQLEPVEADKDSREAIEDWRYWVKRGYQF